MFIQYYIMLVPDKSTSLLHGYHLGNKLLIPMGLTSYALSKSNSITYNPFLAQFGYIVDSYTLLGLGYHSYFSMSSVITDYLPKVTSSVKVTNMVRYTNLNIHILSVIGIHNYLSRHYSTSHILNNYLYLD